MNRPPVTVPVNAMLTTSFSPSARSIAAAVVLPSSTARAPDSMAVLKPAPPSRLSSPSSPVRVSSPAPPLRMSSPELPCSVTLPLNSDASSVLLPTPPISRPRSMPLMAATSPAP